MNALVVPTIRENCIKDFLNAWEDEIFDIVIIVEDNPARTFDIDVAHHFSWKEIKEEWGENSWIFSRRDSAIRSFGFWKAYQLNADVIFTLDDDCYPIEKDFVSSHIDNLSITPKWGELIPGLRTRGLPYFNLGILPVVANIGLWTNIPDLDAVHQLTNPLPDFVPDIKNNRVMPHGQYFPFTGMNFCFKREVAPMTYFPLMGEGQPYRRFDDIWFGILFKKIADHLGYYVTCGHPFVEHRKASHPLVNLVKEAPGIQMNETFWQIVDQIELYSNSPRDCMFEIGEALFTESDEYIRRLGQAVMIWGERF